MCKNKSMSVMFGVLFLPIVDSSQANAQANRNVRGDIATAARAFNDGLEIIDTRLQQLPSKIETRKWTSVKAAALEIKRTAEELLSDLKGLDADIRGLGSKQRTLTQELNRIQQEFEVLAREAENHAAKLAEPLASVANRERETWIRGAYIVQAFREHFQSVLAGYEGEEGKLKDAQIILVRFIKGAENYSDLATVGEKIESLEQMAVNLNRILDMFDDLATRTEDAIAKSDPTTSPVFDTVMRRSISKEKTDAPRNGHKTADSKSNASTPHFVSFKSESLTFRPRPDQYTITDVRGREVAIRCVANVGDRYVIQRGSDFIGYAVVDRISKDGQYAIGVLTAEAELPNKGDIARRDLYVAVR